jgi:hypothetical protein
METFEIRKCLLTPSLANPRQNTKAILRACELFIYGAIHYITNSLKKVLKIVSL